MNGKMSILQGDQLNMTVFFLLPIVKSDFSSVHLFDSVHWTSHFFKVQEEEKNGHVLLVTLYIMLWEKFAKYMGFNFIGDMIYIEGR